MLKNLFIIILAIALVLFVLVPAAFIALGKMSNPFLLGPTDKYNPMSGDKHEQIAASIAAQKNALDCSNPNQSLVPHVRDAHLERDGEKSIVTSKTYGLTMRLDEPVVDWQYTQGVMEDELASFVYKDAIVNVLARASKIECNKQATTKFEEFHTKNGGVEYFSSRSYLEQGRPIGLTHAMLRTSGDGEVGDANYYWYLLDEEYGQLTDQPLVTIWYSTRVNKVEYWFAFRTFAAREDELNDIAEEVLEGLEFKGYGL